MKVAIDKKWNIEYEYNEYEKKIYKELLCYSGSSDKLERKKYEYAYESNRFIIIDK